MPLTFRVMNTTLKFLVPSSSSYEPSEGLTLCSGGRDGTVKLWKLAPIPEPDHHAEHDKQNFHGNIFSLSSLNCEQKWDRMGNYIPNDDKQILFCRKKYLLKSFYTEQTNQNLFVVFNLTNDLMWL